MTSLEKFFSIETNLEPIGLIVEKDFEKYFCTPKEAIVFARSGIDGIHYCIIPREDDVNQDKSPVFVINPMDSDNYVELVGRNLTDFLSLIVSCKDAACLEGANYMAKDEFDKYVSENIRSIDQMDGFRNQVEKGVDAIKKVFNISIINDVYEHLKQTKSDNNFNIKYTFTDEYYEIMG